MDFYHMYSECFKKSIQFYLSVPERPFQVSLILQELFICGTQDQSQELGTQCPAVKAKI